MELTTEQAQEMIEESAKYEPGTLAMCPKVYSFQKERSRLVVAKNELSFQFSRPFPSAWHRFWYRVLLGWEWERIDER